jgi:glycosyltransferase involved in cell wall biosynthesis
VNRNKENLILITRNEIGGVLTYVLNFSKYLALNKIDYKLILYQDVDSLKHKVISDGNILNIYFSKFGSRKGKFDFFKKQINKADILILNDTFESEFVNYHKIDNQCIYILHGDILHYQEYLKMYYNAFDDVFCVSDGLKNKYKLIYPCHTFSVAHPMINDFPIKENFTIQTPIKIASIGRFEYLKGSDTIRDTLIYLNQRQLFFEWTLFIPPAKNDEKLLIEIHDLVEIKRGLNNKQVLEAIEKFDILFFPSRSEGFPMTVIECLKRGIVVIARDIPIGIPEMVFNKENGIICSNELEFLESVEYLDANRNEFLQMKKNANLLANRLFGFDSECSILLELIKNCKVNENKFFIEVPNIDPKMPEIIIRFYRYFKYKFI